MHGNALSLQLRPGATDFALCSCKVEKFCENLGLSPRLIFKITLVLDELITNIISYGYDTPDSYAIDINLACTGEGLVLEVTDDARPFNPLVDAAKPELHLPLEERSRQVGGMGVHLVKSLMDSATYQRVGDKNVLTLKKNLDECVLDQKKT